MSLACQRLAKQQCKYKSAECKYPGESAFWSFTQLNKARRQKRLAKLVATIGGSQVITYDVWREAKFPRGRNAKSRLCSGNIEKLREHLRSLKAVSVRKCQVCNRDCYWKCMLCPDKPAMCLKKNRKGQSFTCAFHFHNNDYFGLCMSDRQKIFGEKKDLYRAPSKFMVKKNGEVIKTYRERKLMEDLGLKL